MNKTDIWMPLYIAEYLADTARLSTEQHGAYLLLIMDYWRNGPPPDDDETLANVTKMSLANWRKAKPVLMRLFKVRDGVLWHKRVEKELAEAAENAKKRSSKSKKAADARWGNGAFQNAPSLPQACHEHATSISSSNAQCDAIKVLDQCPSPSPSPLKPDHHSSSSIARDPSDTAPPSLQGDAADDQAASPAAVLCVGLRPLGVPATPANPMVLAWVSDGIGLPALREAVARARCTKPAPAPIPVRYLDTTVRSMLAEQKNQQAAQAFNAEHGWDKTDSGIEKKGRELGLLARAGEDYRSYADRIRQEIARRKRGQ